ncbi:hypothetical protein [Cohnella sp. GCM10027633]|uniref:hypothetical protein n=1 Tax=unclassified Cohnella TaxID=2636738 RepID=UPI00362F83EB
MDRLVQLAMDNIFFVVIIVGIIYSLFFRKSPLEKPRNRMPDFGGGQQRPPGSPPQRGVPMRTPQQARQEPPRGVPQPVRSAPPPEPRPSRQMPLPAAEPPPEDAYVIREIEAEPARGVSPPSPPEAPAAAAGARAGGQPTREELARAIVWAEVLGPPRAKRPYRGMNR